MGTMKKLTPVLAVDEIEPVLPFWIERLGFEKTVEVPQGDRLGFVIPARDGADERIVRDPAGHVVTFAEFGEGPDA